MFFNPVKRKKLKVTSPYGKRGNIFHYGMDLRCFNFITKRHQPFVATEDSIVLRVKRDKNDNGIIVLKPLESDYDELKYIHINIEECNVEEGQEIKGGHVLGFAEIRGQSKSLHLHFETIFDGYRMNPQIYIDTYL